MGNVDAARSVPVVTEAGFAELYREHYGRVRGLCRRLLGSAALADDAAQETFLRAHRSFARYDPAQPFAAWIMSIATNHCLDVVRRRAKERRLFGSEAAESAAAEEDRTDLLGQALAAEEASTIDAAVSRLPERYRLPLVLVYYRDASYEEAAAALGLTRTHVGALICRAKQMLRRELRAREAP